MKKIYLLAFSLGAFAFSTQAQVELTDDFESYTMGDVSPQADHWRTWSGNSGGAEDADVTDDEALSGIKSLHIDGSGITDMILLTPTAPMFGTYTIQWYSYIPAGASGYFNMQAALSASGSAWTQALMGGNVYFNCSGSEAGQGGVTGQTDCSTYDQVFTFPEDQWFKTTCVYDLDNQVWDMFIDGQQVIFAQVFEFGGQVFTELAGIDFYSASPNNDMYIDDITMANGILSTEDFTEDKFSVYPNPVKDILNIESAASVDKITVYDVLGKVVLQEKPGKISPTVNMGSLSSGTYMVKVTIGNNSKIVKIVK